MATSLIGIGSNLGDREQSLEEALKLLAAAPDTRVVSRSRWHRTRPIGGPSGQDYFLNGALLVETSLGPRELHARLKEIERTCGRQLRERWAARPLDLDLLLYDDLVLATDELTVPHPRMAFRRFVLAPAAEIAAEMPHPIIGWTVGKLLEHLDTSSPYIAVTGLAGDAALDLAQQIVKQHDGCLLTDAMSTSLEGRAAILLGKRNCGQEIALVETRAAQLARSSWPFDKLLVLSPFWWQESLAIAQLCADADRKSIASLILKQQADVVRPRLVVLLDPPNDSATYDEGPMREQLRSALRALAETPGVGPLVVARSSDSSEVIAEISAAIEAMH